MSDMVCLWGSPYSSQLYRKSHPLIAYFSLQSVGWWSVLVTALLRFT